MNDQPRYIINVKHIQRRVNNIAGYPEEELFFVYYLHDTYTKKEITHSPEISSNSSDLYFEKMTSCIIDQHNRLNDEHNLYLAEILSYCDAVRL